MSEPKVPIWMKFSHWVNAHGWRPRVWMGSSLLVGNRSEFIHYQEGNVYVTFVGKHEVNAERLRELADMIDSCREVSGDEQ